jgi:hypothetical protein
MYGEGYDWAQQYSVSSGDFVGSLPVGMQSRGDTDLPYWPSQNMYVYKEVWVHSTSRWLWLVADLLDAPPRPPRADDPRLDVTAVAAPGGAVTIRATATGRGTHTLALRADNLVVDGSVRTVTLSGDRPASVEWRGRLRTPDAPWTAVVVPDGDVARRREARITVR